MSARAIRIVVLVGVVAAVATAFLLRSLQTGTAVEPASRPSPTSERARSDGGATPQPAEEASPQLDNAAGADVVLRADDSTESNATGMNGLWVFAFSPVSMAYLERGEAAGAPPAAR